VGEGASFGRETKDEVVLVSRLRAALERLNPALPPEAITAAMDELTCDRLVMIPGLPFYLKLSFYCSVKHSL